MELNWSTFILEMINFLVLVWILKRFLYRPILDVIARRRAFIENALAEAKSQQSEADTLRKDYETRLERWQGERQQALAALTEEVGSQRKARLEALQSELKGEREKAAEADQHRQAELERKLEESAYRQGTRFVTRLLENLASPAIESALIAQALSALQQTDVTQLKHNGNGVPTTAAITTAFTPADEQRQQLQALLQDKLGSDLAVDFAVDGQLLAGVRITFGAWSLGFNLQDELQGFAELEA